MLGLTENQKQIAQGVLTGSLSQAEKERVLLLRFGWGSERVAQVEKDLKPSTDRPSDNWDEIVEGIWKQERERGAGRRGPFRAADRPSPLSSSQIFPEEENQGDVAEFKWAAGGRVVKVKRPGVAGRGGGRRAAVSWFSERSRRALLDHVNALDQSQTSPGEWSFILLTYPEAFPAARASKRHLERFFKRLIRRFGEMALFWKLEPQKRGAPHYHLLARVGSVSDEDLTAWVSEAWVDVVNPPEPGERAKMLRFHLGHAGNKPCCQRPQSWNGVANYTGKYMAKVVNEGESDPTWVAPGRFWGIRGRHLMPVDWRKLGLEQVHAAVADTLQRLMRRWFNRQVSGLSRVRLGEASPIVMPAKAAVALAKKFPAARVVPIRRRWKRSTGGMSCFLPAGEFDRALAWAADLHGLTIDDLYDVEARPRRQLTDAALGLPPAPWVRPVLDDDPLPF